MQDQTNFWVQTELRKVESRARGNALRLAQAQTLRQVVDLTHVTVPPWLRSSQRAIPGLHTLTTAAHAKARAILDRQLEGLRHTGSIDEFMQQCMRLRQQEWVHLRGEFSQLHRQALQQAERIRQEKFRASTPAE